MNKTNISNNFANEKGGGICLVGSIDFNIDILESNIFFNNSAMYGQNLITTP